MAMLRSRAQPTRWNAQRLHSHLSTMSPLPRQAPSYRSQHRLHDARTQALPLRALVCFDLYDGVRPSTYFPSVYTDQHPRSLDETSFLHAPATVRQLGSRRGRLLSPQPEEESKPNAAKRKPKTAHSARDGRETSRGRSRTRGLRRRGDTRTVVAGWLWRAGATAGDCGGERVPTPRARRRACRRLARTMRKDRVEGIEPRTQRSPRPRHEDLVAPRSHLAQPPRELCEEPNCRVPGKRAPFVDSPRELPSARAPPLRPRGKRRGEEEMDGDGGMARVGSCGLSACRALRCPGRELPTVSRLVVSWVVGSVSPGTYGGSGKHRGSCLVPAAGGGGEGGGLG
ncbi:unnamed protein product [Diplocarpon coronariae]